MPRPTVAHHVRPLNGETDGLAQCLRQHDGQVHQEEIVRRLCDCPMEAQVRVLELGAIAGLLHTLVGVLDQSDIVLAGPGRRKKSHGRLEDPPYRGQRLEELRLWHALHQPAEHVRVEQVPVFPRFDHGTQNRRGIHQTLGGQDPKRLPQSGWRGSPSCSGSAARREAHSTTAPHPPAPSPLLPADQALWKVANERPQPIPFFGELGSGNPLVALPGILETRGDELRLVEALGVASDHCMLTPGMRQGFDEGVARLAAAQQAHERCPANRNSEAPSPRLFEVSGETFLEDPLLRKEVFGPAAVVVWGRSIEQAVAVLDSIGGSLTATLWGLEEDSEDNRQLLRAARRVAGRVLFGGVPTGVAVCRAQVPGGPWPASTRPETTSVGYATFTWSDPKIRQCNPPPPTRSTA